MRHRETGSITAIWSEHPLSIQQHDRWLTEGLLTSETIGPYVSFPGNALGYVGSSSSINDEKGGVKGTDHPCIHHTLRIVEKNYPKSGRATFDYEENYPPSTVLEKQVNWKLTRPIFPIISNLPPYLTPEMATGVGKLGDLFDEHVNRVRGVGSSKISLANFLLEINDLRRGMESLEGAFTNPKAFESPLLAWELGIKPFLSDLKSMAKALANIANDYERLRDSESKPIRVTTTKEYDLDQSFDFPGPPTDNSNGAVQMTLKVLRNHVRTTMVSRVAYDFSRTDEWFLAAFAAARAFGVTEPLKVAWNAIPYSFVVDWVYSVSDLLGKFDLAHYAYVDSRVLSSSTSIKWERKFESVLTAFMWPNHYALSTYKSVNDVPIGAFEEKFYQRWVGTPLEKDLVRSYLQDPSLRKLVLSILLGSQLLPKRAVRNWLARKFKAWWNNPDLFEHLPRRNQK